MSLSPLIFDWTCKERQYWLNLMAKTPRDDLYSRLELPKRGAYLTLDACMFLAIAVAQKGVGNVAPNPLVGAVLLDANHQFLASGAHLKFGHAHAEVNVINQIANENELNGATLVVTLEPCAHQGKTPACAEMIAATKIARVFYGSQDPNPKVNGRGVSILKNAGKKVESLSHWQTACEWLARVFFCNQTKNSIFTAMKVASTPKGIIAGFGTKRLWITGERARQMGHYLRLEYDAILVGANTVVLDDPQLNMRHPYLTGRPPLKVVLDPHKKLKNRLNSLKLTKEDTKKVVIFWPVDMENCDNENDSGVHIIKLSTNRSRHFSWTEIKKSLANFGISSLLIEGGAGVYQSALNENAVDAIHWFIGGASLAEGLVWPIPDKFSQLQKNSSGTPLEQDRLIESFVDYGLEITNECTKTLV